MFGNVMGFGLIFRLLLLVAGGWWCKEILGRWREDMAEMKTGDGARRGVIVGMWGVTVVVVFLMGSFVWGIVARLMH